jgi:hypothetical protein
MSNRNKYVKTQTMKRLSIFDNFTFSHVTLAEPLLAAPVFIAHETLSET